MPSFGRQWNLTKVASSLSLSRRKVLTPKPSIMRKRARDGAIGHRPHDHVGGFGHQADEIPERVVGAGGLRIAAVGLHLHRVNQVGELDRVLDEEHRDVVADQIPVAFLGVELHREAADVARRVDRARAARHGREADEHLGLFAHLGQDLARACSFASDLVSSK